MTRRPFGILLYQNPCALNTENVPLDVELNALPLKRDLCQGQASPPEADKPSGFRQGESGGNILRGWAYQARSPGGNFNRFLKGDVLF